MKQLTLPTLLLLLALPALPQTPKAKSVEKEGDWDVVTLESGAFAKISVPKSVKKGEQPGLVVTCHGHGGEPNQMLQYGRALAEHRGDVWCAYRGSQTAGPGFGYDVAKDGKLIPEMTRYVVATYDIDPKRVILHGFSAGGAASCFVAPANKDLFAGFVPCAAPDVPGGRGGGDMKGLRAVVFLGDQDPNWALAPEAKKAVERFKPDVCFWGIEGLAHQLPDVVYLNDAFNFVLDATEKGSEKTLPLKPDHDMAAAKGRTGPPPDYFHVYVAWKTGKSPAGVTRNKLQAKSLADGKLARLRKGELTLEAAVAESDDAGSKEMKGAIDFEGMKAFGQKLVDKAKGMKPETWEMVETESGYHLVYRAKAP
jgi:predicted esterase